MFQKTLVGRGCSFPASAVQCARMGGGGGDRQPPLKQAQILGPSLTCSQLNKLLIAVLLVIDGITLWAKGPDKYQLSWGQNNRTHCFFSINGQALMSLHPSISQNTNGHVPRWFLDGRRIPACWNVRHFPELVGVLLYILLEQKIHWLWFTKSSTAASTVVWSRHS